MNKHFTWDGRTQRYRDKSTGRFIKNSTITRLMEQNIQSKQNFLQQIFTQLIQGEKDLITFQVEAREAIKYLHTQQYLVARGGFGQTKSEDYLAIGRSLKDEHYARLRAFVEDVNQGKLTEREARHRLQTMGLSSKSSYYFGQKRSYEDAGYLYARRFLGLAEHCIDCPIYAALGVVNIADIILPTQKCDCRYNCKCSVRYYKTIEEARRKG